jgi:peptidoglycan/LPS O-acetylase OafA/YrhL
MLFAKRRFIRLWIPAIVAQVIYFYVSVVFLNQTHSFPQMLASLPLVNGGLPGPIGSVLIFPVVWTLWYEARYSVVLFICKLCHVKPHVRLTVGILIAVSYCFYGHFFDSYMYNVDLANLLVGNAFISVGGIFWHAYNGISLPRYFYSLVIFAYFFQVQYPLIGPFNFSDRTLGIALFGFTLCLFLERTNKRPSNILTNLGKYSYSIYLAHFIFGVQAYILFLPHLGITFSISLATITCIGGVFLFYKFIENPSLVFISKIKIR